MNKSDFSYLVCRDAHMYANATRDLREEYTDLNVRLEVMYRNRVMAAIEAALCFHAPIYVAKAIFDRAPHAYLEDLQALEDRFHIYLGGADERTRIAFIKAYAKEVDSFSVRLEESKKRGLTIAAA